MSAIEFHHVAVAVGARDVLDDVTLAVDPGEVVALVGPSGCGKSTLLRLAAGFLAPKRGSVRLRGVTVASDGRVHVQPEDRRLAWVPQDLALWPHLTVAGNLAFGLAARGVPEPERCARVAAMLARVGLGGLGERAPGTLSGGERQRVAIGRALVGQPDAVLLDEPFTALDLVLKPEILGLVRGLLAESGAATLVVTHDPGDAVALASRVVVLEAGKVAYDGPASGPGSPEDPPFARAFRDAMR